MFRKSLKLIAVALCAVMGVSFSACKEKDTIQRDETTINVRAFLGGYGATYLTELEKKFEALYSEEGYKVNILTPTADAGIPNVVITEMASKEDWADVYFTGTIPLNKLVNGDYGTLVADVSDVWELPAIGFDGTEESVPIKDKLNLNVKNDYTEIDGKRYGFYSQSSLGGMIVNADKLAKFGITEIPKTSNELFEAFEAIHDGAGGQPSAMESSLYPITYIGGTNGYPTHFVNTWFAQYTGTQNYEKFWGLVDDNGNWRTDDGYLMYEDKGLEVMLEAIYRMHDPAYIARGSNSNTLASAHTKIMNKTSGAVFMADGNWAYNEIITDYPAETDKSYGVDSLRFANVPVISALGIKLFGSGTTYNFSDEKCEEVLRFVIDRFDSGDGEKEIISAAQEKGWDLKSAEVNEIMAARGIYCARDQGGGNVFICEKSQNKDIAKLFLRMFASDDNAVLYHGETNGYTAFTKDFDKVGNNDNDYMESVKEVFQKLGAYGVWTNPTGLRLQIAQDVLLPDSGLYVVQSVILEGITKYDEYGNETGNNSVYAQAAAERIAKDREKARTDWPDWVGNLA